MSQSPSPIDELRAALKAERSPVTMVIGEHVLSGLDNPADAKTTINIKEDAFERMRSGVSDSGEEFVSGHLTIDGDMAEAMKVGTLITKRMSNYPVKAKERPDDVGAVPEDGNNLTFIDNVGYIASDLDQARKDYEHLGFEFTPLARHTIEAPGGELMRWGTGNHCAMFENGSFLELIGHVERDRPAGFYGDQLKKQGAHWGKISVRAPGIFAEVDRLNEAGQYLPQPATFHRHAPGVEVELGVTATATSKLISYPDAITDGFMLVGMHFAADRFSAEPGEHHHPNGVQRIAFGQLGTDDIDAAAERYASALGLPAKPLGDGYRIAMPKGTEMRIHPWASLPYNKGRVGTGIAGAGFVVQDLSALEAFMQSRDVQTERRGQAVCVATPRTGVGALFFFEG